MSLSIVVYCRSADGARTRVDLGPGGHYAGFERWRINVWGSQHVRELGLRILPDLDRRDIRVSGRELEELDAELRLLSEHLSDVTAKIAADGDVSSNEDAYESIRQRLANIVAAVRVARERAGELVIC